MNGSSHALGRRRYGAQYERTEDILDLKDLAVRIRDDLMSRVGAPPIPDDVEFAMLAIGNVLLHVTIAGLGDRFTFADTVTHALSEDARYLMKHVYDFIDEYNWVNPEDLKDRRFFCTVFVAAEVEYRNLFWTSDVLSVPMSSWRRPR
jgi:hypothetical protein